jgi:hypothetical protein
MKYLLMKKINMQLFHFDGEFKLIEEKDITIPLLVKVSVGRFSKNFENFKKFFLIFFGIAVS